VSFSQKLFWLLCLLSIAGAVVFRRKKIILYPLVVQMLLVAFVVGITFGSTRYRAPLELCLVILSSAAIEAILVWGARRTGRSSPPDAPLEDEVRPAQASRPAAR
jgi:hypothetical protein